MPRTAPTLFSNATRQLASLGERLRVARLRRRYSAESVAKRAGVARGTLYCVEDGKTCFVPRQRFRSSCDLHAMSVRAKTSASANRQQIYVCLDADITEDSTVLARSSTRWAMVIRAFPSLTIPNG